MPASGKAADSGFMNDRLGEINTSLGQVTDVYAAKEGVKADNTTDNTAALLALANKYRTDTNGASGNRNRVRIHLSAKGITRGHLPMAPGIVWCDGELRPPTAGATKHLVYPVDSTWINATDGSGAHRSGLSHITICGEKDQHGTSIVPKPTGLTITTTSGSLAAGDYAYQLAYKTSFGVGEACEEVHAWSVPASGGAKLTWTNPNGAQNAQVVVYGRAAWDRKQRLTLATLPAGTTTWVDNGSVTPAAPGVSCADLTAPSVVLTGAATVLDNVTIHEMDGTGLYSVWQAPGIKGEPWYSAMEARHQKVTIENTRGPGLVWNGPHDSHISDCIISNVGSGFGSGSAELRDAFHMVSFGPLVCDKMHVWGTHRIGWHIEDACRMIAGSSEGATWAQVVVASDQVTISGGSDIFPGRTDNIQGTLGISVGRDALPGGDAGKDYIPAQIADVQLRGFGSFTRYDSAQGKNVTETTGAALSLNHCPIGTVTGFGDSDASVLTTGAVSGVHDVRLTNQAGGASTIVRAWKHPKTITLSDNASAATWASMPSAVTELYGKTLNRNKTDLSGYTKARLTVSVGATAGAAGSGLAVQYSTDQSTWKYLDEATLAVGTTGPSAAISTASTLSAGGWVTIASGAKADVFLRVVGTSGNGSTSPIIGNVTLHLQ